MILLIGKEVLLGNQPALFQGQGTVVSHIQRDRERRIGSGPCPEFLISFAHSLNLVGCYQWPFGNGRTRYWMSIGCADHVHLAPGLRCSDDRRAGRRLLGCGIARTGHARSWRCRRDRRRAGRHRCLVNLRVRRSMPGHRPAWQSPGSCDRPVSLLELWQSG